jgi:hypothetical protein
MANPTSNFNWQMPTPTDLVTDLPADFEVFGQAVDTSLADLKGGTTDQVLAKNSNTDMDFKWVTSDDANAIQNAIVNAKGDIIGASANDTPAITSVGANYGFLQADSGQSTGLAWNAGAWTSYTPGLSSITLGNGTLSAAYIRIGKFCSVRILLTCGSTTVISTFPRFDLTFNSVNAPQAVIGSVNLEDTGTQFYWGVATLETQTNVQVYAQNSAGTYVQREFVGGITPFTWTTGDKMHININYEVA